MCWKVIAGVTHGFQSSGLGEHLYMLKTDEDGNSPCNQYSTGITIDLNVTFDEHNTNTSEQGGGIQGNVTPLVSTGGVATNLCGNIGVYELFGNSSEVNVYPNPFSDQATISINVSLTDLQHGEFVMLDVLGKEVMRMNLLNTNSFTIERGNLPDNIYFYNIVNNSKVIFNGKLMITN